MCTTLLEAAYGYYVHSIARGCSSVLCTTLHGTWCYVHNLAKGYRGHKDTIYGSFKFLRTEDYYLTLTHTSQQVEFFHSMIVLHISVILGCNKTLIYTY